MLLKASPLLSDDDYAVARRFVDFSLQPTPQSVAAVPFSSQGIYFGYSDAIERVIPINKADDWMQWEVHVTSAERDESMSPLTLINDHVNAEVLDEVRTTRDLEVSAGLSGVCGMTPTPVPANLVHLRVISIGLPSDSHTMCSLRFTTDLFLAPDGSVRAVRFVVGAP